MTYRCVLSGHEGEGQCGLISDIVVLACKRLRVLLTVQNAAAVIGSE